MNNIAGAQNLAELHLAQASLTAVHEHGLWARRSRCTCDAEDEGELPLGLPALDRNVVSRLDLGRTTPRPLPHCSVELQGAWSMEKRRDGG